ncbi:hypothetical protein HHK36_024312 [Tetracentron sinense]|uniref:DDT domain-containing protein n=1 Tax=Tetracentron sinense TaxID=13715 RepID=A0A835D406_TETSI|nr:hypothetical protein HHK36_024312 [Tetracentron sinense]
MAVSSSSVSSAPIPSTNNQKKRKKETGKTSRIKSHHIQQQIPPPPSSSPTKRTKSPRLRVVEAPIFESENAKYCHQCRQKIMGSVACKNQRNNKPCSIKICRKCLLNRYGEKTEDMANSDDWKCPKCRGICNCSSCMKKRGQQPTGILVHTAKSTGFSSVSEMIHAKGSENLGSREIIKNVGVYYSMESGVALTRKCGKENRFEGESDSGLQHKPLAGIGDRKKAGKSKREELSQSNEDGSLSEKKSPKKSRVSKEISEKEQEKKEGLDDVGLLEKLNYRMRIPGKISSDPIKKEEEKDERNSLLLACNETQGPESPDSGNADNLGTKIKSIPESQKLKKNTIKTQNKDSDADFLLPQGDALTTIAGIDLPAEDVGHAMQFLEFCAAFGEVLDMKKGQPESVLRELMHGRSCRRGHDSVTVRFHIQLLSLIQKDSRQMYNYLPKYPLLQRTSCGSSWLQALGKCISKSRWALKELPSDCLGRVGDEYNNLDSSKRLRLLNFLCDEALGTVDLRSWIDEQTSKFVEGKKEAKQKVLSTKDNEKRMKYKLQDEVTKAILLKNGAPLSISEHEVLVSKIKTEAALVHAEMLEAQDIVPKSTFLNCCFVPRLFCDFLALFISNLDLTLDKEMQACTCGPAVFNSVVFLLPDALIKCKSMASLANEELPVNGLVIKLFNCFFAMSIEKQRVDAVRTEPILLDGNGRAYWRLKSYPGESNILLQDISCREAVTSEEKWFTYDVEQTRAVDKYISSLKDLRRGLCL